MFKGSAWNFSPASLCWTKIENCCKEGEEKHEILYFLKANWLRKTIQEKENLFTSLDGAIKEGEKENCQLKLAVSSLLP